MELKIIEMDDVYTHVALVGRLDVIGATEVESKLGFVIARKKNAILDLAEVSFLGSLGIRLFIKIAKALDAEGKKLILANPRSMLPEVLDASGIAAYIAVETDTEKAIEKAKAS